MDFEIENTIIGSAYDAGMDGTLWSDVIGQILEYTHSTAAILTTIDRLNPSTDFLYTRNIPQVSLNEYRNEQIKIIDLKQYMPLWKQVETGGVINQDLSHYTDTHEKDDRLFYERCLKVMGACYIAGVLLERGEYRWSFLAIHRSANQSAFQQREIDFLKRIGIHIRKALQINQQLNFSHSENKNLYQMMDVIRIGIILIDSNCKFYYANERAQGLMEQNNIFEFDAKGHIHTMKQHQQKFAQLIQNTQDERPPASRDISDILSIHNMKGQQFMLTAKVFNSVNTGGELNEKQPNYVILFISEKGQSYTLAKPYLKETYALSMRECEICELFLNGFNLEKIATHCHLTLNSVRTYLKTIYNKMQCNSQAELLHKLMDMTINFEHVY